MMSINGDQIMDRFEVWSVWQKSSDGEETEIACPEGEAEARRTQAVFGGYLTKRPCYVGQPEPVEPLSDEETLDLV